MTNLGRPPPRNLPGHIDINPAYLDWLEAVRFELFARALGGILANPRFNLESNNLPAHIQAKEYAADATALWAAQYEEASK